MKLHLIYEKCQGQSLPNAGLSLSESSQRTADPAISHSASCYRCLMPPPPPPASVLLPRDERTQTGRDRSPHRRWPTDAEQPGKRLESFFCFFFGDVI